MRKCGGEQTHDRTEHPNVSTVNAKVMVNLRYTVDPGKFHGKLVLLGIFKGIIRIGLRYENP